MNAPKRTFAVFCGLKLFFHDRAPAAATSPYSWKWLSLPFQTRHLRLTRRPFFLFVGRPEKLKGLQTTIPIIREHAGMELAIAGDGDYASELKRLAGDCERIHFLGGLTSATYCSASICSATPEILAKPSGRVAVTWSIGLRRCFHGRSICPIASTGNIVKPCALLMKQFTK